MRTAGSNRLRGELRAADYLFLFDWMKDRLKPLIVANVPMEAFQGFCRAKTNFYVFEKIG